MLIGIDNQHVLDMGDKAAWDIMLVKRYKIKFKDCSSIMSDGLQTLSIIVAGGFSQGRLMTRGKIQRTILLAMMVMMITGNMMAFLLITEKTND